MLILRIRQAEVALSDGRLDDAFEQAVRPEVRQHRRGQRLATRLVAKLVQRGQAHLEEGRVKQALSDCDRAARLGGNQPDIARLRATGQAALQVELSEAQQRRQAIDAARKYIGNGDLSLGMRLCDVVADGGSTVAQLSHDVEIKRLSVDAALARARLAVKGRNLEEAIAALIHAKSIQPHHRDVMELSTDVARQVCSQVHAHLDQGRLDQAQASLARLRPLSSPSLDAGELDRILAHCRTAGEQLRAGDVVGLSQSLKSLRQMLPRTKWLDRAIRNAENAVGAVDSLRAGPLGLLAMQSTERLTPVAAPTAETDYRPRPRSLPQVFLLQVDGAGSCLVVRKQHATFGPTSTSRPADVEFLAQAGMPQVAIERVEDDYFLRCDQPVLVNSKHVTAKLLGHGDKISLGRRGGMRFLLPCAATTSAALELFGVRMPRNDTRRVILMDDAIVVSPHAAAHVRGHQLARPIVLFTQTGQLRARPMKRQPADATDGILVEVGRPVEVDGTSFVITAVDGIA